MQGRGTVHQYRVTFDHIFKNIPNHRILAVDDLLGRFYGLNDTTFDEFADHEGFVQLGCHILRNTHLVHFQLRTYDDN